MISYIISRTVIMVFGTIYPAYASYKAVRSRNVREYVKWMMYWIVFAIFSCIETFTDIFLSWFPFYYELKILLVIWLLAPATKGSSILYRKFVHPTLSNKEQEIDEYISKAKEQSYKQVLDLGTRGMSAIMQTAIKSGGGLVNQIKKSYSLSDLTNGNSDLDEQDCGNTLDCEPRLSRHSRSRRVGGGSPSITSDANSTKAAMYYSQLNIRADSLDSIPSEDLSSGYYSGDANLAASAQLLRLQRRTVGRGEPLQRTSSLTRTKPTRVTRSTGVAIMRKDSMVTAEDPLQLQNETENLSSSSTSDEDFQDTIGIIAGENGPSVPNAFSALANDTIVNTHQRRILSFPSSNTTPLNKNSLGNADSIVPTDVKCSIYDETVGVVTNSSKQFGNGSDQHDLKNETDKKDSIKTTFNIDNTNDKLEQINVELEGVQRMEEESLKSENFTIDKDSKDDIRAGKYNKRHAPAVPEHIPAITAKLVLKPGILKPLTNPEDSSISQMFCHSPKIRRKSRGLSKSPSGSGNNRSRSRSCSKSPCRTKTDASSSSFMKLSVLHKKLFNKESDDKDKNMLRDNIERKLCHEQTLHGKMMTHLLHQGGPSANCVNLQDNDVQPFKCLLNILCGVICCY